MKKMLVFLTFACLSMNQVAVFAQATDISEEREESSLDKKTIVKAKEMYTLEQSVGVNIGYETNPRFSSERKGDMFEEFMYSATYAKNFPFDMRLTAHYSLDVVNYNEFTGISNNLHYIDVRADKRWSFCQLGIGYNAGFALYPNSDTDFILHNGYVYLGKKVTKNTYHRLKFEYGKKDYLDKSTLADALNTYQEKDRLDKRLGAEYSVLARINPKISLQLKTKFIHNDSNARFEDFYDYSTLKQSINFRYKFRDDMSLYSKLSYRRKEYDSRTITFGTKEQTDDLYSGSVGVSKDVSDNSAISLEYTYRENTSNDPLAEYSESMITCGWNINF
jgi:OmpA family protein